MNNTIDPTYLRAIREGLLSGKLEKENEAELPDGIAELFEKELFPLNMAITEKQLLIHFFTSFALVQKEVTPEFIAEILERDKEVVYEYIFKYSKWFSGSGNNQFRVYHDRFRVYILQKITPKTFFNFNDKLISICNQAISSNSNDENELYALEYLSSHLYVQSMLNGDGSHLKQFAYDTNIWEHQVKTSKGFEWSKKMLEEMMQWASKFDDEEVIECALNKVDLYYQEQNDAPRVIKLVADGEIETALQRIAAFSGNDKDGLQRKFILYMLCLMELTLLNSKHKEHSKNGIEKILKDLDYNLPSNQPDLINWKVFFPSNLIFEMAIVWRELHLDFNCIINRTSSFDYDWIVNNGPYNKSQIELLLDFSTQNDNMMACIVEVCLKNNDLQMAVKVLQEIPNNTQQYNLYARLSTALKGTENAKGYPDNFMSLANNLVLGIENRKEKSIGYAILATENYFQGNHIKTEQLIDQSLSIARLIEDIEFKCSVFSIISLELVKQDRYTKAYEILLEGLKYSSGNDKWSKKIIEIFSNFVDVELKTKGTYISTLESVRVILDQGSKAEGLIAVSTKLLLSNFIPDSELILSEAISTAEQIEKYYFRYSTFQSIAIQLCVQGKLYFAMEIRTRIADFASENDFIKEIIVKLLELNQPKEAELFFNEFADKLIENNQFEFIKRISAKYIDNKNVEIAYNILLESLTQLASADSKKYSKERSNSRLLVVMCSDLAKIGKFSPAQKIIDLIDNEYEKARAIEVVSIHLSHYGHLDEAINLLEKLKTDKNKIRLVPITIKIFKIFFQRVDLNLLLERLLKLLDIKEKSNFLKKVESEIIENGTIEDFEAVKSQLSSDEKATFRLEIIEMQILKYIKEENYKDALQRIGVIEANSERISISLSLAFKSITLDKVVFAYELVESALQEDCTQTKHLFSAIELSAKIEEFHLPEYSYLIILLVKRKIDQIDESKDKNELILASCTQLINLKLIDEALDDLKKVKDLRYHSYAIIRIAKQLFTINEKQKAQLLVKKMFDLINEQNQDSFDELNSEFNNQDSIIIKVHLFELSVTLEQTELSDKIFADILNSLKNSETRYDLNYEGIENQLVTSILKSSDLIKLYFFIEEEGRYIPSEIVQACALFGNYKLAEQISSKIKFSQSDMKSCWEKIGEVTFKKTGFEKAYKLAEKIESVEIKKSFKLGIINQLHGSNQLNDYLNSTERFFISKITLCAILKDILMSPKEYNYILQIYSLNQIFFEELPQEKLERFNYTLNLQWAIDIKNQLPN